ncbi:MAG: hypothetical protein RIC93_00080, partial [Alphaproteobacteria bacterium]
TCRRSELTSSSKTCVMRWLRHGVGVTLTSRLVESPDFRARTTVSFTATDIQTEAKLRNRIERPVIAETEAKSR